LAATPDAVLCASGDVRLPLHRAATSAAKGSDGNRCPVPPDREYPGYRLPVRICAEVAVTIAANLRALPFSLEGSQEELDRQIGCMVQSIAQMWAAR
jgi:hypothetical protein